MNELRCAFGLSVLNLAKSRAGNQAQTPSDSLTSGAQYPSLPREKRARREHGDRRTCRVSRTTCEKFRDTEISFRGIRLADDPIVATALRVIECPVHGAHKCA